MSHEINVNVVSVFLAAGVTALATGLGALPFLLARHPGRSWLGLATDANQACVCLVFCYRCDGGSGFRYCNASLEVGCRSRGSGRRSIRPAAQPYDRRLQDQGSGSRCRSTGGGLAPRARAREDPSDPLVPASPPDRRPRIDGEPGGAGRGRLAVARHIALRAGLHLSPAAQPPISSLKAGSSRIASKSESSFAYARNRSDRSIARRRCSTASVVRPARLSQQARL